MEYSDIQYHSVVQSGETGDTYEPNEHTGIFEPVTHDVFPETDLPHFRKMQKVTGRNLININDVYLSAGETIVCYAMKNDTSFAQVDTVFKGLFFRQLFERSAENLRLFTTDIITGIKTLHQKNLYHGNLNLKTTYFCWTAGSYIPTLMLGGFKRKTGSPLSLMLQDWNALGILLQELVSKIELRGRSKAEIHEFKDLCHSLINNHLCLDCNLNTMKTVPEKSIVCGDFVLKHPVFLDVKEIPSYILLTIAKLEEYTSTGYLITEEVFDVTNPKISLLDDADEAKLLEAELLNVHAIPRMFSDMDDPRKGFLLGKMERNLLSHPSYIPTGVIGRNIGTTSSAICAYFRKSWPNLLPAIHKAIMRTKYRFDSYISVSPDATVWR